MPRLKIETIKTLNELNVLLYLAALTSIPSPDRKAIDHTPPTRNKVPGMNIYRVSQKRVDYFFDDVIDGSGRMLGMINDWLIKADEGIDIEALTHTQKKELLGQAFTHHHYSTPRPKKSSDGMIDFIPFREENNIKPDDFRDIQIKYDAAMSLQICTPLNVLRYYSYLCDSNSDHGIEDELVFKKDEIHTPGIPLDKEELSQFKTLLSKFGRRVSIEYTKGFQHSNRAPSYRVHFPDELRAEEYDIVKPLVTGQQRLKLSTLTETYSIPLARIKLFQRKEQIMARFVELFVSQIESGASDITEILSGIDVGRPTAEKINMIFNHAGFKSLKEDTVYRQYSKINENGNLKSIIDNERKDGLWNWLLQT